MANFQGVSHLCTLARLVCNYNPLPCGYMLSGGFVSIAAALSQADPIVFTLGKITFSAFACTAKQASDYCTSTT